MVSDSGHAPGAPQPTAQGRAAGRGTPLPPAPPPAPPGQPSPPPELPPWPRLHPNWAGLGSLFKRVAEVIGGGTALLAVGTVLLTARLDLPTATFIVLHSQPLNIALAALTAVVPVGVYVAIVLAPRLLVPSAEALEPGSPEALRHADLRRALEIVGIMLAWASLVFFVYVYVEEYRTAGDGQFVLSFQYLLVIPLFALFGVPLALLFMRWATLTRRGTAGPASRRMFFCVRAGVRGVTVLTIVVPVTMAAYNAFEDYVTEPPLRIVYFEDEYRTALEDVTATGGPGAIAAGWTVRWLADGDGGYYFLPEDKIFLNDPDATTVSTLRDDFEGPSKILWRAGEPLKVTNCDFALQTCDVLPPRPETLAPGESAPEPEPAADGQ